MLMPPESLNVEKRHPHAQLKVSLLNTLKYSARVNRAHLNDIVSNTGVERLRGIKLFSSTTPAI